tara:strand:+ start:189 stop:482 length:294 start_codon:yes stop_codon:yes gene_type:complete
VRFTPLRGFKTRRFFTTVVENGVNMKDVLLNGIKAHLIGEINKHIANIEITLNSSKRVQDLDRELLLLSEADSKLQALGRYIIKPEEESNQNKTTKK